MSEFYFDFEKQRPRISRREAIRRTLFAGSGLVLANHISFRAFAAAPAARAKAVIQIWMWGGPSHLDIFDPKPEAGYDYCGPLKSPIETNVSGIRIGELLPLLAKQADKYSIIRSMTHGNNGHETASYIVQTGRQPGGRLVFPCVGSVVSLTRGYDAGYKGLIPPYVVLTEPQGRFDEAGFLGARYKPFATGGNPAQTPFAVEGVVLPGFTDQRQKNRRELLHHLDTLAQALPDDPQIAANTQAENMAYDMILGDGAKVFDLSQEKQELRDRYGKSKFGQSCLVARRLVERGIPYVTINYGGWDTHKENFQAMRRQLPDMDKGFATLLQDLSERGLLDSTIVWWGGEFGRTPKVHVGSAVEWRARITGARFFPTCSPAADSKAAKSLVRPTRKAKRSRTARFIRWISSAAFTRKWASRRRRNCRIPKGCRRSSCRRPPTASSPPAC